MDLFASIERPTLLLDASTARRNIQRMAEKALRQGIRFRPHFKTHQSMAIGEWFRPLGVTAITTSSVEMAQYFAAAGWNDITIAFPVNVRQAAALDQLAESVHLELLVESPEVVDILAARLTHPIDLWIKIDVGNRRTGLPWDQPEPVLTLARAIQSHPALRLRGLLTHAGQTYAATSPDEVRRIYQTTVGYMNGLRRALLASGIAPLEVSVGDTPGVSLCPNLGQVDEIRPGNFVLYDAQQLLLGACQPEDIAAVVACPVVARHPQRCEVVVYGGAIHLSKDIVSVGEQRAFGLVALPLGGRWSEPLPGAAVRALSQEHGMVSLSAADFSKIQVGDLVCIIPAHSCLTVQLLRRYLTLEGNIIPTLNEIPHP